MFFSSWTEWAWECIIKAWQAEADHLNCLLLNQPTRDNMNDFDQVLEDWDTFLDDTEDFDDVKIVEED